MQGFDGKSEEKKPFSSPSRRWDDNINNYFEDMRKCDRRVDLVKLAQDSER